MDTRDATWTNDLCRWHICASKFRVDLKVLYAPKFKRLPSVVSPSIFLLRDCKSMHQL